MNSNDNSGEINIDNSKKGKKKIILLGATAVVALLIIIVLFTIIIPSYNRNKAAKEALNAIQSAIDNQDYSQAFNDLATFKTEYDFGKYPKEADKNVDVLNDLADKAKKEGLKKISSDNSEYFEDTYQYFKDYTSDYSYDEYIDQVNNLLQLIEDYKKKDVDLNASNATLEWYNNNSPFISYMEDYIKDVDSLHELADECINNKNYDLSNSLYNEWDNNYDYYYGMIDDINTMTEDDLNNTLMMADEYSKFKNLIIYGLLPAESYYQSMNGIYLDDDTLQLTRDSWSKYNSLYDEVTTILADKKSLISIYSDTVDTLTNEVNTLLEQIKSYSFDDNGTI